MSGRIYLCHHQAPDHVVSTSLFSTMVTGTHDDPTLGVTGDLDGINLAGRTIYSEMRQQFHVWQERLTGADYVGFEHYRRVFFINPLSAARLLRYSPTLVEIARAFWSDALCPGLTTDGRRFRAYLDLRSAFDGEMRAMVDAIMDTSDIVTPQPHGLRLDAQFRACHSPGEWEVFVGIIRGTRFYARSGSLIEFSLRSSFFCNMYIMRSMLFTEYMEFWWEVMTALETRIERSERALGYFSERLVNLFVNGKRLQDPALRVSALPLLIHDRAAAR